MDYAYAALDRGYIPDFILRRVINALNRQRLATLSTGSYSKDIANKLEYIESLKNREIAIETEKANKQHYEVSTDFMMACLGKRAKYRYVQVESLMMIMIGRNGMILIDSEGERSKSSVSEPFSEYQYPLGLLFTFQLLSL